MNKKIIFACTSGIATSAVATEKVVNYCKEHGINIEPIQSNIGTIANQDGLADIIIVTSAVKTNLQTPVLNGLPLLTGFGEEELLEKIVSILKK
ncbi:PTS sugar transporter subunit IIB [Gibbsiella dentisursi]|uniref:PTS sugar transporter subunit IIB n=1 Tax=Gibbsiella dentisursi TaxID=796890 RepID=A0ABP7KJ13_9GAMM